MARSERADEDDDEERRRRAIVVFLVLFVLAVAALGGAAALGIVSFGGTGELTVEVVDQNGDAASGQDVQVLDPETGAVVASSTTGDGGEAEFTLDQGEYEVVVADSSRDVQLDEDTTVDLTVDVTPPDPN